MAKTAPNVFCVPKKPIAFDATTGRLARVRAAAQVLKARLKKQAAAQAVARIPTSVTTAIQQQISSEGELIPPPFDTLNYEVIGRLLTYASGAESTTINPAFTDFIQEHRIGSVPRGSPSIVLDVGQSIGIQVATITGTFTFEWVLIRIGATLLFVAVVASNRFVFVRTHPDARKNAFEYVDLQNVTPYTEIPPSIEVRNAFGESPKTFKVLRDQPYGRTFRTIRPPGTPRNAPLTYHLEPADFTDWLLEISRVAKQDIIDYLNSAERPNLADALNGIQFTHRVGERDLYLGVAAEKSNRLGVPHLAYDSRTSTNQDPGPFGAQRGLLESGTPWVNGPGPEGRAYDDRAGGVYPVHPEERAEESMRSLARAEGDFLAQVDALVQQLSASGVALQLDGLYKYFGTFLAFWHGCQIALTEQLPFPQTLGYFLYELAERDLRAASQIRTFSDLEQTSLTNLLTETQTARTWSIDQIKGAVYGRRLYQEIGAMTVAQQETLLLRRAPDTTKIQGFDREFNVTHMEAFEYVRDSPLADRSAPRGSSKVQAMLLHSGSIDPLAALSSSSVGTSTHFIVWYDGRVEQHIPLSRASYHAAGLNSLTIGIDLATPTFTTPGSTALPIVQEYGYEFVEIHRSLLTPATQYWLAPENVYEAAYALIQDLREITEPSMNMGSLSKSTTETAPLVQTDQGKALRWKTGIALDPGQGKTVELEGALPHAYVTVGKTDILCLYIYIILRDHDLSSSDARARLREIFTNGQVVNELLLILPEP